VPRPKWAETVAQRAAEYAARSARSGASSTLPPLVKERTDDRIGYRYVEADLDRAGRSVAITVRGPDGDPGGIDAGFWTLAMTRQLDDLILDLRTNEPELGTWVFRTAGDPAPVMAHDAVLLSDGGWLANETLLYLKRTLKRLDVTSRSLIALIEPGSCFAGSLLELALAADRSYQLASDEPGGQVSVTVTEMNLGPLPMGNGLSRLATRFYADDASYKAAAERAGEPLSAEEAEALGLVTFAPDDIDWDDEVRIALEERASFSPDALTGMEANYRFAGPETMETKIFGRLTAWQNWIFHRPNASGPDGALRRFGTGQRAEFDRRRV
jgi:benzoyl-CoA-dihydrodiol lyase